MAGAIETFPDVTSLAARERINQKLRAGWKLAPIVEVTNAARSFNAPNRELEGSRLIVQRR
jgi:hypothetical protein